MSKFSDTLQHYIKDRKTSIYQISKKAELDRTTLQRAIKDERIPSTQFLEKLCDFLCVSPSEHNELLQYAEIAKIGEERYQCRTQVQNIIEQIARLHLSDAMELPLKRHVVADSLLQKDCQVFSGIHQVNALLLSIMEEEIVKSDAKIRFTLPCHYTFFFECLQQLYVERQGHFSIQHIIQFAQESAVTKDLFKNVALLSTVLPLALCVGDGYDPYYLYDADCNDWSLLLAMPYYCFTSRYLVTVSADFQTAILFTTQSMLDTYQAHFQRCLSHATKLVYPAHEFSQVMDGFQQLMEADTWPIYALESYPCFGMYYTKDMLVKYLHPAIPNREQMIDAAWAFFLKGRAEIDFKAVFFSKDGLLSFVDTGVLSDLAQFTLPLEPEDRKQLLTLLREDMINNQITTRMINTSKFLISPNTCIQLYEDDRIMFNAIDGQKSFACAIKEQSISCAFLDFCKGMDNSELIYTKEETLDVLQDCIDRL